MAKGITSSTDIWRHTGSKKTKVSYKWTIDDISLHCKQSPAKFIESSKFSCGVNDKFEWCLRLYPSGYGFKDDNFSTEDCFTIILRSLTRNTTQEAIEFKLHFVDINNRKKDWLLPMPRVVCEDFFEEDDENWVFVRRIDKSLLLKEADVLLPDDILTILCEIVILDDTFEISGKHEPLVQSETLVPRINDDYQMLFETGRFSDIIVTVSGKNIEAHKAVLAARSPVFLAMFMRDMIELKTSQVTIDDVEHKVFMETLRFIYTDRAPNLDKMAMDLLMAADKYGLDRLKAMCTVALCKILSIDNATDILVLSYLHNAESLKDLAIKFICDQTKDFMETATFKSMASSYPALMVDILCGMNTRRNGSKLVEDE